MDRAARHGVCNLPRVFFIDPFKNLRAVMGWGIIIDDTYFLAWKQTFQLLEIQYHHSSGHPMARRKHNSAFCMALELLHQIFPAFS